MLGRVQVWTRARPLTTCTLNRRIPPGLQAQGGQHLAGVTQLRLRLITQKSDGAQGLTWIAPAPWPGMSPQVHWSGVDVHYRLESHPLGPFDVDAEGNLYVTRELDTEAQAEVI